MSHRAARQGGHRFDPLSPCWQENMINADEPASGVCHRAYLCGPTELVVDTEVGDYFETSWSRYRMTTTAWMHRLSTVQSLPEKMRVLRPPGTRRFREPFFCAHRKSRDFDSLKVPFFSAHFPLFQRSSHEITLVRNSDSRTRRTFG